MKYKVIRTETADAQIRKIILYLAENFGNEVALEKLEKLEHLHIFADTSSLEIFVNHGEEVFTTRIYNCHGRILINGECSGIMTVYPLKSFEIEGGRNEE